MLRLALLSAFALTGCVTVEHPYAYAPPAPVARVQYEAPPAAPQGRFLPGGGLPAMGAIGFECGHIDVDEAYLIALGCWVAIQR